MQIDVEERALAENRDLIDLIRKQHVLTFRPFGPRIRRVRLRLRRSAEQHNHVNYITEITVGTRRGPVVVRTQNPDPVESMSSAFSRAKRDVIRRLNSCSDGNRLSKSS